MAKQMDICINSVLIPVVAVLLIFQPDGDRAIVDQ